MGRARLKALVPKLVRVGRVTQRQGNGEVMVDTVLLELRSERRLIDARRLASVLGVSVYQVARAVRVSRQLLYRHPDAPKIQRRAAALEQILANLIQLYGGEAAARAWLKTLSPLFGGRSAWDFIQEEPNGLETVQMIVEKT